MTHHTSARPANSYLIEFADPGWRAWFSHPGAPLEPVRFSDWAVDRSDNLIGDDPMQLMQLAHVILSDALSVDRSFDAWYHNPDMQAVMGQFLAEVLGPVRDKKPTRRGDLSRAEVVTWAGRRSLYAPPVGITDAARVRVSDVLSAVDRYRTTHGEAPAMTGVDVVATLAPSLLNLPPDTVELITPQVLGILHDLVDHGVLVGTVDLHDPRQTTITL